ncbi:MAG TPA: plasmid pRiA4b ORF-3 family protein [Candidatus Thermoplasmatota archaeon]
MTAYLLDVTLAHLRPKIWRQLHVPGDLSLGGLHEVLQIAFGWQDCHLHEFRVGERRYGVPDPDGEDEDLLDDADMSVARALPRKSSTMQYIYDFGDCWIHNVVVHRIEKAEAARGHRLRRPVRAGAVTCLAGARACPPEDCGGPHGYAEFLEAITSPEHPEHDAMLTWVGGAFDPEAFSLSDINRRLSALA